MLADDEPARLDIIFAALDPVRLLALIGQIQEALWVHAVLPIDGALDSSITGPHFTLDPAEATSLPEVSALQREKRPY